MFKSLRNKLLPLLTLCSAIAVTSCNDNFDSKPDYTVRGEDVVMKVDFSFPRMEVKSRAALDEPSLNNVTSLWIRTYSSETGLATSDWIEVPEEDLPTIDTEVAHPVNIRTKSGPSYIVAVANVSNNGVTSDDLTPRPLSELLENADTWAQFLDIAAVTPSSRDRVNAPVPPLTMVGSYSPLVVNGTHPEPARIDEWQNKNFTSYFIPASESIVDMTEDGAIHMRRVVSHINFNIIPANDLTVAVNSYQVVNAPRYGWLYERPAVGNLTTNFGDQATSEENAASYYADVPAFSSQYITEYTQDNNVCSTFDFWQGENKHTAVQDIENYVDRSQRGTGDNSTLYTSLTGDVWTPNNEASYVLVNCSIEYKNSIQVDQNGALQAGGTTVSRTGEVTYIVHLGALNGNNDFNCFRNVEYTYNLHVNGVNDIRIDAHATDATYPEAYHGEEGMVVDLDNSTIDLDAHYATFNIQLTEAELRQPNFGFILITYENGVQYTITDALTQEGTGVADKIIRDEKGNVIPAKYYNWVELRPTTDANTLATYRSRYNAAVNEQVTFLLTDLKASENGTAWDAMTPQMRSASGWYTVFVNEYTYEPMYTGTDRYANEEWNGNGQPAWMGYVNQNPRRFYIRVTQSVSPDGNSIYARSKYGVSQQSMMTYYSEDIWAPADGDIAAGTAIGVERENETLGFNLAHSFGGGSRTDNGRWNTAQWLMNSGTATNLTINSNNANNRPQWVNFIEPNQALNVAAVTGLYAQGGPEIPAHTAPLPAVVYSAQGNNYIFNDPQQNNNYRIEAINACMSRNRDNNGNGRIEPDELRWFVPGMDTYLRLMLAAGSLPEPMIDYAKITQLPHTNTGHTGWVQPTAGNYDFKNDYCSRYMYVSSNSGFCVMWTMEGTSVSEYNPSWANNSFHPWQVRCIRNLGSNMTTVSAEHKVASAYTHDSDRKRFIMNYYDPASIRPNRYRGNGTEAGQMPVHTLASDYNKVYYAFEYSDDQIDIPAAYRPTGINNNYFTLLQNFVNSNPCRDKGTDWRIPNQLEITIMRNAGLFNDSNPCLSCSVNYFNYRTGAGSNNIDEKLYMMVTSTNATQLDANNLNNYRNTLTIRCVRDVNPD